jgi:hypothetical protein
MAEPVLQSKTYSLFHPLLVLVVVAAVVQLVRIFTVAATPHGETPFLSANDRSRWCTIASLTEDRSFVIDRFLDLRDSSNKFRTWYSIDMVRKTEADGSEHYYSSKPPLLSVMYAAVCSPIASLWNRRLSDAPLEVGRTLLVVTQWLPMTLFWIGCWIWILRCVNDSWQQMILLSFVLFGTFLTTFTNTLNNHLPAAISMAASLVLLRMVAGPSAEPTTSWRSVRDCILLGLTASFTAACDLPALAWAAILLPLVWLLTGSISRIAWMVFGMLPLAIAFAATNWIAYGDLKPPYAHREELGPKIATVPLSVANSDQSIQEPTSQDLNAIGKALQVANERVLAPISIQSARRESTWEASFKTESDLSKRFAVVRDGESWAIHQWNDWYDYPKSYWLPKNKRGVDLGEPSIVRYAFHVLIGHHGVLSLTPFWFLSLIGLAVILKHPSDRSSFFIALAIATVTAVCLAFYISRPLIDRNYGGVASGFRWMFWLIPAWFYFLPKGLESASRSSIGKVLVIIALIISVFWATIPWENPWQSPLVFTWLS